MKKILLAMVAVFGMLQLVTFAGDSASILKAKGAISESRVAIDPSSDRAQEYDWEPKHISGQRMVR